MVLHNPSNWHWVDKPVGPWAKEWFQNNLVGIEAEHNGTKTKIDSIMSMEGDCDVCQRKGKVIAIYDLQLKLEFSGMSFIL
jgi:activator of HSP90 ATPase